MSNEAHQNFGELLLSEGLISPEQFEEARVRQKANGMSLSATLVDMGAITEGIKNSVLKKKFGFESVVIATESRDEAVLKMLPKREASRHRVIPLRVENDQLVVAMEEPNNVLVVDYIKTLTSMRVLPMATSSADVERALKDYPDEERRGLSIQDKPLVVQILIRIILYLIFFAPVILAGYALFASEDETGLFGWVGPALSKYGPYEIGFYTLFFLGFWGIIVWYVNGVFFPNGKSSGALRHHGARRAALGARTRRADTGRLMRAPGPPERP